MKVRDTTRKYVDHTYILGSFLSTVSRAVQLHCIVAPPVFHVVSAIPGTSYHGTSLSISSWQAH